MYLVPFVFSACGKKAEEAAPAPQAQAPAAPQPEIKKVWVETDPVQCQGNPWDKYTGIGGLVGFFGQNGVKVYDTATATYNQLYGRPISVCRACTCPQGHALYLWVAEADAAGLAAFGFKASAVDPRISDSYAGSRRAGAAAAPSLPAVPALKPGTTTPAAVAKPSGSQPARKKPARKKRRRRS